MRAIAWEAFVERFEAGDFEAAGRARFGQRRQPAERLGTHRRAQAAAKAAPKPTPAKAAPARKAPVKAAACKLPVKKAAA